MFRRNRNSAVAFAGVEYRLARSSRRQRASRMRHVSCGLARSQAMAPAGKSFAHRWNLRKTPDASCTAGDGNRVPIRKPGRLSGRERSFGSSGSSNRSASFQGTCHHRATGTNAAEVRSYGIHRQDVGAQNSVAWMCLDLPASKDPKETRTTGIRPESRMALGHQPDLRSGWRLCLLAQTRPSGKCNAAAGRAK